MLNATAFLAAHCVILRLSSVLLYLDAHEGFERSRYDYKAYDNRERVMAHCTVASYNIHRCIGLDGRNDPERIARVIEELEPDVIGLQEVESRFGGSLDMHQLNYLAEETGYQAIAGSTVLRADSHYGNALLTRHRVCEVRTHDVSVPKREPRGILDVDLEVHGEKLRVLVTHLGLGSRERRRQTRMLLAAVAAHPDESVVVLSDFNEWFPWRLPLRWMHARLGRSPALNTFPAMWPVIALDRIWVAPRRNLLEVRVHDSALARVASDHRPLRAIVELRLQPVNERSGREPAALTSAVADR